MKQKLIKRIRVLASLFFFISIGFLFIDFGNNASESFTNKILYLQFVPSLLKFINILSFTILGFLIVLVLTALFGRVYCSYLCPLGVLQDIIIYFRGVFRKKGNRFRYKKALNIMRYSILAITVIFFLGGSIFFINLLDPYSIFGRISTGLFRPLYVGLNNITGSILESYDIYYLYPYSLKKMGFVILWLPSAFLLLIVALSLYRGRLYCNSICPVGSLLGLLSKLSIYKIKMDTSLCTKCGKCMFVCKANCINIKEQHVDFSRCVGCYNCIAVCPDAAIGYKYSTSIVRNNKTDESVDTGKRRFISSLILFGTSLFGLNILARQNNYPQDSQPKDALVPVNRKNPVTPPGSLSIDHFKNACTACHLCVNACPTDVLQPAFLTYGLAGMMQPHMDFIRSYCNYSCTTCSEICPTGAIIPINEKEKKTTQTGIAHFIKQNCIVYTDDTACLACAEHCPTTAVHMTPYGDGLKIPEVTPEICIGCGACEYACPAAPYKAIYVEGNPDHQLAKLPPKEEALDTPDDDEDFPF